MQLKEITMQDKPLFDAYIGGKFENSEAVFGNLFLWRNIAKTKYALVEDALVIFYQKSNGCPACCYPFGNCDIKAVIQALLACFREKNCKFIMESVPASYKDVLMAHFGDQIKVTPDRDLFDYVYTGEKLRELSGKKLHSKRNHINKFLSLYPNYQYVPLTPDLFPVCLNNVEQWLLTKYQPSDVDFHREMTVMREAFTYYEQLGFIGGALLVDGEVIAFTFGERLTHDTCVVHVEKANTSYHGAYTMINNAYIQHAWPDIRFVNREEDMGIAGIRKAKLSYVPDHFVEKYQIEFQ